MIGQKIKLFCPEATKMAGYIRKGTNPVYCFTSSLTLKTPVGNQDHGSLLDEIFSGVDGHFFSSFFRHSLVRTAVDMK